MHNAILEQLTASDSGISVCWLGNLSWLICAQGQLMAFDLDLDLDLRLQPSPVPISALAGRLNVLFITHEHGDHFNAATGAGYPPPERSPRSSASFFTTCASAWYAVSSQVRASAISSSLLPSRILYSWKRLSSVAA